MAKLALLYFAAVREAIGRPEEQVDLPDRIATVGELVDWLARDEPYASAFRDRARLRAAIDQQFAPMDAPIAGAREVALFPPVTGG